MANNLCTGCDAYNGTYYLDWYTGPGSWQCDYRIVGAVTAPYKIFPCASKALDLNVVFDQLIDTSQFRVTVQFGYWPDTIVAWGIIDSGCGDSGQGSALHCMQTFTCTATPAGGACVGSQTCVVSPA